MRTPRIRDRGRRARRFTLLALTILAGVVVIPQAGAQETAETRARPGSVLRVSIGARGEQANAGSERLTISGDGRYATFVTRATNLVRGATTGHSHAYLRDLHRGKTTVIDVDPNGRPGNGNSWDAMISGSGRYVVFFSDATNLVSGGTNGHAHIYVRDLQRGKTVLADVDNAGRQSDTDSIQAQISPTGRFVVFMSRATNLAPGKTGDTWNVFVRDLERRTTRLISEGLGGAKADAVSYGGSVDQTGRYVSFASLASNLIPNDTNGVGDVFRRDLKTGAITRVSLGNGDVQGDDLTVGSSISADGGTIGFSSHATNLAPGLPADHASRAYVRDLRTGRTISVDTGADGKPADAGGTWTGVTGNGRYAVFQSMATNVIPGKTTKIWDVYRRDLVTGEIVRASTTSGGKQGNGENWWPTASADGSVVGFLSFASDIIPADTNGVPDAYVRIM